MDQYPLWTNLVDIVSKDDKNYHRSAQFVNTYLTFKSDPVTLEEVKKKDAVKATTLVAPNTPALKGLKFVLHENAGGSVTNIEVLEEPADGLPEAFTNFMEDAVKDTSANAAGFIDRFEVAPDVLQTLESLSQTSEDDDVEFDDVDTNANDEQSDNENCAPPF